MTSTFVYATCDGWQIWNTSRREATKRAAILAGRTPYVLLKGLAPASEIVAWHDLSKVAQIKKVLETKKAALVERKA